MPDPLQKIKQVIRKKCTADSSGKKTTEPRYYPNVLDRRNNVAIPRKVYAIDLFSLKIKNLKKPQDGFKAMIALDLATGEIVAHEVFRIPGAIKGEPTTRRVIAALRPYFMGLEGEFVVHVDQATHFTSWLWAEFMIEIAAIPSMSARGEPRDNGVVERAIRTMKSQLLGRTVPWPTTVKSLREVRLVMDQRVEFVNTKSTPRRACGITPAQLSPALKRLEHLAPERILAHKYDEINLQPLMEFKQLAVSEFRQVYLENPYIMLRDTRDDVKYMKRHFEEELKLIQAKLDTLVKKNQKTPRKQLPLRDPAEHSVFHWIMRQPKAPKLWPEPFCRFRIAVTLLYHTGMRAAEVAEVTDQQIDKAIKLGQLDIILAKTRGPHRYVFTQAARKDLAQLEFERIQVFARHTRLAASLSRKAWSRFINAQLQPAVQRFGLNIKSHSFRVGYITNLLKRAPVQHASVIVGHKDLRSTMKYNRYLPNRTSVLELLEPMGAASSPEETKG